MIKYSLEDILTIKESHSDSDLSHLINEDVKRYLFIIDYKFKEKKGHRSKYNNPKPISFNDIRLSLNKLSNKTFDIQFKYIISTLHLLSIQDKSSIFKDILNHLSNNAFMLEPYSKLTVILIDVFEEFKTLFYDSCHSFFSNFDNFVFPVLTTYNEICIQNKTKDNIKAQCSFYISTLIGLDEIEHLENCLNLLQNFIQENLLNNDQKDTVEFVSNIHKTTSIQCIKDMSDLSNVISSHVAVILQQKNDKNINRKIIFNHMDINDFLEKNR